MMAAAGATSEMKNWQTDGARRDHIWQGMIRNTQYMQRDMTEHTFTQM